MLTVGLHRSESVNTQAWIQEELREVYSSVPNYFIQVDSYREIIAFSYTSLHIAQKEP